MILEGCQGKKNTSVIKEQICPKCGSEVEYFSTDVSAVCEHCNTVVYNEAFSCVRWCEKGRECVGEEVYEQMLASFANLEEEDEDEW